MRAKSKLTENAIMYTSVGFEQDCLLQVLSIRQGPHSSLQMVLYDGIVYTGASYNLSHGKREPTKTKQAAEDGSYLQQEQLTRNRLMIPRQLDVIRTKPMQMGKDEPLYLSDFQIVERNLTSILGREVLSLDQYMKRRKFISYCDLEQDEELEQIRPNKKIKNSTEEDECQNSVSLQHAVEKIEIQNQSNTIKQVNFRTGISNSQQFGSKNNVYVSEKCKSADQIFGPRVLKNFEEKIVQKNHGIIIPNNVVASHQDQHVEVDKSEKQAAQNCVDESKTNAGTYPKRVIQILMSDEPQLTERKSVMKKKVQERQIIDLDSDLPVQVEVQTQKAPALQIKKQKPKSDMMIQDLYERMNRFRILCRINNINHFTSKQGYQCTKMMLIDEKGDQILCYISDKSSGNEPQDRKSLLKGRTYFFERGEVEKDQNGFLSLSVPLKGIQETKLVFSSFNPRKMIRVGQVENFSSSSSAQKYHNNGNKSTNSRRGFSKELNICGILIGLKQEPKLINNQFKLIGTLGDPNHQKCINFVLFLGELTSFPQSGAVISLHNMHPSETERTIRLEQSKRSYYLVENHNPHPYFTDLILASQNETWKLVKYKNLSDIQFVVRTIAELRSILSKMLDQDQCFSEIDCNIASVREKREFAACATCRHEVKSDRIPNARTYCLYCKKLQKVIKRFIFTSEVADSTGSIDVNIYSQEIEPFINVSPVEYAQMGKQSRNDILELSSYQNILLRVKSIQKVGGCSHIVTRAEKNCHRKGLQKIKEGSIQDRMELKNSWP